MCGWLQSTLYWGPGPQPRHVPQMGIEPAMLWFAGPCSIRWATPARAEVVVLNKERIINLLAIRVCSHRLSCWNVNFLTQLDIPKVFGLCIFLKQGRFISAFSTTLLLAFQAHDFTLHSVYDSEIQVPTWLAFRPAYLIQY